MKLNWSFRLSRWAIASIFLLTFSYLASFIHPQWIPVFAYRPLDFINSFKRLTPITFCIVTDEHVTHWLTVLAILIMDRLTSDCWSKLETLVFLLVVNLGSLILSTLNLRLSFFQSESEIVGNAALIAAVTVISTQFDADRYLLGYGKVGLKSRHGFCYGCVLFFFCSLIRLTRWTSFLMFMNGFFVSWFYLRFLQHHPQRKFGDHRASFALAKFFPGPLEPWVALPSNLIYTLVLRSRLCPGVERQSEIVSTASFAVNIPGLTSDTDRHRRIALRILNERLLNASSKPMNQDGTADWPDLNEADAPSLLHDPSQTSPNEPPVLVNLPKMNQDLTNTESAGPGSPTDAVVVALPTRSETPLHVI
ncbi:Transmembrane protein [Fasciola hepatica]|uniref:Transmembrane protein n=1 Tax=Fasciola hepatica TaxID=6192 RepID=A0A4E0RJT6_FASHE|nr:Transmembrane protein [Fasciola hepatica]